MRYAVVFGKKEAALWIFEIHVAFEVPLGNDYNSRVERRQAWVMREDCLLSQIGFDLGALVHFELGGARFLNGPNSGSMARNLVVEVFVVEVLYRSCAH